MSWTKCAGEITFGYMKWRKLLLRIQLEKLKTEQKELEIFRNIMARCETKKESYAFQANKASFYG